MLIQLTANAQEIFTKQWLTVLDSSTSNVDQLSAGLDLTQTISGGCSTDYYDTYTPKLALSYSGNQVACIGMSDCDIFTSALNTSNGSSAFQDIYTNVSPECGVGVIYDKNNNLFGLGAFNFATNGSNSSGSNFLRKYDSTGVIQFTNIIHNYIADKEDEMRLDDSGRVMLANVSYNSSQNFVHPLYCYSNSGTLQWTSIINVNYDYYYGYDGLLEVDDSNNTVFTGKYQPSADPSGYEVVIRKVNSAGAQLWQVNYSSYPECFADKIAIDKNGDIYMLINTNAFTDERLVKFSGANGAVIWDVANTYGDEETGNIKINIDSNVIVMSNIGQSLSYINYTNGNTIWSKTITNGRSLGTDINGNIYEVSTDMLRIYSSAGTPLDSVIVSIPGYTTTLNSIVINPSGNIFYLLGERSTASTNKIFITKFSNNSSINCSDSSVDITTGLVAWYPFKGNANDNSGNGNNGTVHGATLTSDRFGNPNSAYLFNGSSDYIHVNMATPLNTTTISGLSMSIWCKLNSITTNAGLMCFYDSTNSDLYGFQYDQTLQKLVAGNGVNGQDGNDIFDTITPDTSTWYNLIYTCDYSTNISNLYFNGVFQAQNDTTLNRPILSAINIGRWFPGGTGWFTNGKISDVRIYNRVLTSCDADSLYHLSNSGSINCSSSSVDITTGLVGLWSFTGNANDSSGNGNNGTVYGAILTTDRFGNPNSAYSFNGTSDYIQIPNNTSLDLENDNSYTISTWVQIPDYSFNTDKEYAQRTMISMPRSAGDEGGFAFRSVDNLFSYLHTYSFGLNNTVQNIVYGIQDSLPLNTWTHLAITYNYDTIRLYKNGVEVGDTVLGSFSLYQSAQPLFFGKEFNVTDTTARWFKGNLDDIRIYNRALTSCDVDSLYNLTSTGSPTSISNFKNDNFKMQIFPNPSSGQFNLQLTSQQNEKVELIITDIVGRVISNEMIEINQGINNKEITQPLSGIYFITIKTDSGQQTDKLIVIQ